MAVNQQLLDYITSARAAKLADREIRKTLSDIGWPEEKIAEAFLEIASPAPVVVKKGGAKEKGTSRLERVESNPIIEPVEAHSWESKSTFNPGAFYEDGKVHLFYRAIGDSDVSVLGYAASSNGITIDERSPYPAYAEPSDSKGNVAELFRSPLSYISGGGWNGGCEDPRLTVLDGRVYLIYTAFDGWASLRIALTSMSLEDFRNKAWKWKKPVYISPPGEIHKNWVLFPEKIGGKYAVLHGISPEILIDYFDSLEDFDGKQYINSTRRATVNEERWDSSVRGAGPPPLKTKDGWLLLYHATDYRDPGKYKLGAMLLDLNDPTKILFRAKEPVLEPVENYENDGFKAGVVYACGAVVVDGMLFVYYGGADSVVCLATADLGKFIAELERTELPKLKNTKRPPKK